MAPRMGTHSSRPASVLSLGERLLVVYAVLGVSLLLVKALTRLAPIAWQPVAEGSLSIASAVLYVGWALLNAYLEGYRGFQKRFVPRVLTRALFAARSPTTLRVLLAPAFAMGFFQATRRVLGAAWGITIGVTLLVIAIRTLPQPWRGIIDVGVVTGLSWGLASLLYGAARLLLNPSAFEGDPEIEAPAEPPSAAHRAQLIAPDSDQEEPALAR